MTDDELHDRYHCTTDPVERSHRYVLWLLVGGMTADAVAAMIGYSAYRIGHIAGRYNRDGPDGVWDQRHATHARRPELPTSQPTELGAAVAGPHPEGDRWRGRAVAARLSILSYRELFVLPDCRRGYCMVA